MVSPVSSMWSLFAICEAKLVLVMSLRMRCNICLEKHSVTFQFKAFLSNQSEIVEIINNNDNNVRLFANYIELKIQQQLRETVK